MRRGSADISIDREGHPGGSMIIVATGLNAASPRFAVVSGLPVTLGCRMYKSPAEIALMKKASEVTYISRRA